MSRELSQLLTYGEKPLLPVRLSSAFFIFHQLSSGLLFASHNQSVDYRSITGKPLLLDNFRAQGDEKQQRCRRLKVLLRLPYDFDKSFYYWFSIRDLLKVVNPFLQALEGAFKELPFLWT